MAEHIYEDEDGAPLPEGLQVIIRERLRQINELGYNEEHDKNHTPAMFVGAALYLLGEGRWHMWVKRKSWRSNLVRAGALIAAAIDKHGHDSGDMYNKNRRDLNA